MKEQVDLALRTGDSVGGVFEVVAHNVPPGLGTYVNWDERLDTRLAAAVMSLQAVKGVEIGDAVEAAYSLGSAVHDEIGYQGQGSFTGFSRGSNHAGGLEGGMSNGEDIRVRGYLKPISTLASPVGLCRFRHPRAGEGGVRTLRCLRGACRGSCSRSHGRAYNCTRGAGEVWWRFPRRTEKKLRRILSAT